ncbi:biotin-independent malonate decarboxylase subunit beta [Enterococcus durans]|uniref:Biotin-independent malonate decarboxylase subunit beta n=2 Tax=Enterococcus durans TaxID=53345 RepID=A0A377L905_9ENTE|nr:biotin-independent malonate decarboxylase subunit beta [Enterococcus durans]EOT26146.1 malonate decarboxylase, beta subunit [Enterococcus durans ATCC 6056]EOU22405.1 malonate decarboxylase, beta subunit [Enterococcus durans ATCC 6056]MDB1684184.1 biotin-independent malonate decarboxylase subunit beta [Enterococcus durans]PEH45850.1 biotin-independent malonate decarboxylase subunit beta [Enterococcus durans]QPQ27032.1 biotin-independent malonate decarboxylase subunit beta [Enterococcus duran
MKNSFVELNARDRVNALLDNGHELIDPFDQLIAPSLLAQGIVPESDDGIVVSRGTIAGKQALVIAMEGKFQGGGIGEVSGAKIVSALEHALEENKKGNEIFPIIVLDTGGVRLQEANYGLLSISEIGNMIIALKEYVPVIGLVPGRVGSFGGMSITSALMSYLIATKKARVGLNGPEVIEQEAGVREFDSSDKDLIWNTLGSRQRVESKIIDELVTDSVESIKEAVVAAINERKDTHRSESSEFYLSLLDSLDLSKPMTIAEYNEAIAKHQATPVELPTVSEGDKPAATSVGYEWFEALTDMKNPTSFVGTVYYGESDKFAEDAIVTSIVPDPKNPMYRVRNGEVGLVEGFRMGQILNHVYEEDKDKVIKRPIVIVIDVPSQAYGYNEELIGIHVALANSAAAYAKLRQAGHPVIGLIAGNAISGAFLAHGLQSSRLIALNSKEITVQAMSKASAARVTKRTIAEIEAAADKVPAIAYDINNYTKLGAIHCFLEDITDQKASEKNVNEVIKAINAAISDVREKNDTMLTARYTNETAKKMGRVETNKVRAKMAEEWDA